ncbi:substrate-binding periplasmic protein [Psychromonas ossibalaenae]|uniref:substrate-binding periplasmic protein n=1 Tax=Psychromonas ossibalaenae TaxID=444922 RepID=UPI000370D864|nr:transporter substrate-binding domain-containing protein [Psychromonas ossibalaenae]
MNIFTRPQSPLLFILLMLSFPGYTRDFTIIASPQAPHKFSEEGVVKGIDVEVISHVMRRLDIKYKIRLIKSAARIIQEAKSGRADMVLLFSRKESRMDYLIYPNESYIDISWNFFILKENSGSITYETFNDLKGLKVGITNDISYTPEFISSGLTFDDVSQNYLQIKKLLGKRIDIVPLNTISTLYEAKKQGYSHRLAYLPKPLKSKPYYNVFPIASQHPDKQRVMEEYDQVIRDLKEEQIIAGILNKYLTE